ncbi:ATP/GTP-binding protein [Luteipulveratus mongoliensis]|uniref:ATP/GTP-binding protein n=1 Tax=Luteipulveratus mongoliensis TaxID=571913 RepID=A0A0K1JLP6_9MICO|nr:hypothetical protein [Luteipulveratus mongoliensis]AKU17503.1 ATP/GTP-binding protein [Luteipulveratus mongoliensis]
MPRRNRPRRDESRGDVSRIMGGGSRTESYAGGRWVVRSLRGSAEDRSYVCPGCQQQLSARTAHVVVWPADGLGDVNDRRHWHTTCWSARDRRPPQGSWR